MNDILKDLNINNNNHGCGIGGIKSFASDNGGILDSFNPSTGEKLATIQMCSVEDYEKVIEESQKAFKEWRMVPAPIRGQLILEMANKLRAKKDLLGSLVSLEMGKIKAEGDGEVQEMIPKL